MCCKLGFQQSQQNLKAYDELTVIDLEESDWFNVGLARGLEKFCMLTWLLCVNMKWLFILLCLSGIWDFGKTSAAILTIVYRLIFWCLDKKVLS